MSFEFHLPTLEDMRATGSNDMLRMIDDDEFRSALITGCPGSGKTTVSIYRLVRLSREKKRVYLVTFQNMLVLSIRALANIAPQTDSIFDPLSVSTFNAWYKLQTGIYFNVDSPPTIEEIERSLSNSKLVSQQIVEIIIDEGQDLPSCVFETIPRYSNRVFIGADENQMLHSHGTKDGQIKSIITATFGPLINHDLGRNFRNTYETYRFARQFLPRTADTAWDENILERLLRSKRRGIIPTVVTYRDSLLRDNHLLTALRNADGNVAILCPLGKKSDKYPKSGEAVDEMYEFLLKNNIKASRYHSDIDTPDNLERYVVTTFKSAKGMEFDEVLIPRINFFKKIAKEWYVACTRAKKKVTVYRDLSSPQNDPIAGFDVDTYESISLVVQPSSVATF